LNTDRLDKLVAWKAAKSLDNTEDKDIIECVRAEILLDISKRYPWSFLERKSESISISAGDTEKNLPYDFVRIIGVALIDSDNVVYPVHSEKPATYEEEQPDEDDTDRPHLCWIEWDATTGKPKIVLKSKSDGSYTLRLRYQKKILEDQVSLIPDGLAAFYGMMMIVGAEDQMVTYKNMYEAAIGQMWASDMPDLNDMSDLKPDKALEIFNQYMGGLL